MAGTAILLGVLTFLIVVVEYAGGRNFISQPIMAGFLTGLVMGDMQTGIIVGATLELAFLGATSIGAVIPPDAMTGTILGTAFVIHAGASTESALVLALPIASVVLLFKNFYYGYIVSIFEHTADQCAEAGDAAGIERLHIITGCGMAAMIGVLVTISYAAGSEAMSAFLNWIPDFVQTGLNVVVGLLPAIGFAMLSRTMLSKSNLHIFLCGFAFVAYLNVPILGIALFGAVLAMILVGIDRQVGERTVAVEGGEEDDL